METSLERGSSALTSIEKVMLLQSVELFKFCSAEEILRIAEISRVRRFDADEVIYRDSDEPEFLYCIVEGRVRLRGAGQEPEERSAGRTFGVIEILSGRLRQRNARALEPTTALVVEAGDFFDLLSNNVEIVKALFRKVLDGDRPQQEPDREE